MARRIAKVGTLFSDSVMLICCLSAALNLSGSPSLATAAATMPSAHSNDATISAIIFFISLSFVLMVSPVLIRLVELPSLSTLGDPVCAGCSNNSVAPIRSKVGYAGEPVAMLLWCPAAGGSILQ